jgi:putative DNA primase/helicase
VTAAKIAAALGGARREGRGWRCRCPLHGGRSLVIGDGREGRLLIRCWGGGCAPADILAELRQLGLLDGEADYRPAPIPVRPDDRDDGAKRIAWARRIWDATRDARGSPVARYLAGRAITLPPPSSLRWAPRCWHREARAHLPAMVALVEHVERGVVGVHRTYLARDDAGIWRRRDRASLGPIAGGAVRLAPAADTLMVGEGVETCLAAMQTWPLPAWAALSTSGLVALMLPPSVGTVVILADCDANGAGERAAYAAADRWLSEDRRVKIAMPPEPGIDFNDVLLGRAYARIMEAGDVAA